MARNVNLKWVDAIIAKDKQTCLLCIKKGYHRQEERAKWSKLCQLVTCTLASVRDHEVVVSAITSHTQRINTSFRLIKTNQQSTDSGDFVAYVSLPDIYSCPNVKEKSYLALRD